MNIAWKIKINANQLITSFSVFNFWPVNNTQNIFLSFVFVYKIILSTVGFFFSYLKKYILLIL